MRNAVWVLTVLGAACSGAPTRTPPRPLDAPAQSFARVYERFLSPGALARDLGSVRDRTEGLFANEADLGAPVRSAGRLARGELDRLPSVRDRASQVLGGEADRLGDLRHSRAFSSLDPADGLGDLARASRRLPRTLQLDRRAMSESDDHRFRTDPDDNRPEASFSARIWRRLFP